MKTALAAFAAFMMPAIAQAHGGHPDVAAGHSFLHLLWIGVPGALALAGYRWLRARHT